MFERILELPVHPAFVHFPVALLSVTWGLVVFHHWTGSEAADRLVRPFELIGVGFLPVAVLTGIWDAEGFGFLVEREWDQPLIWHFIVSATASLVFAGHAYWRVRIREGTTGKWIDLALPTIGFWLLVVTGLIAAEMVFG